MPRAFQFARAHGALLSAVLIAPLLLSQAPSAHARPASRQKPTAPAAGRSSKSPMGGIIYGRDWMVLFGGVPRGWVSDTGLANRFGIQEIFHPPDWDPNQISPCITFALSHKAQGDSTVAENMSRDEKKARARFPNGKILPAPPVAVRGNQRAPVRIYQYPHGWDMVVYSEGGGQLFVSTLHCETSATCAPFRSSLLKFVKSLEYKGNMKIIDQTRH